MAGTINLYQAVGGAEGCHKLSAAFYARVARDPVLRPFFPGKSFRCAIEAFSAFLAQFLGGPSADSQFRWFLSLRESHLRFKIGPHERDAWVHQMTQALDEVEMEEPLRGALRNFFEQSSAYLVNHGVVDTPGSLTHPELTCRWELQRRLDEAVAAVRRDDAGIAGELAETCDRTVLPGLLALMIASGHPILLGYVREKLTRNPSLTQERYAGRTLLHAASAAGSLTMVELLLRLGADPNVTDGGGHTPLYSVGNECVTAGGGDVVRALVRAGAKVDARDGVKHCTALHMAARRGNVEVAEALLDCGADIESRDSLGDTPLRRSVNCGKTAVAALLLARGADIHSTGSKGLTPLLAARSGAMSRLLRYTT
jgi:truncated hemoglobin YjbI